MQDGIAPYCPTECSHIDNILYFIALHSGSIVINEVHLMCEEATHMVVLGEIKGYQLETPFLKVVRHPIPTFTWLHCKYSSKVELTGRVQHTPAAVFKIFNLTISGPYPFGKSTALVWSRQ